MPIEDKSISDQILYQVWDRIASLVGIPVNDRMTEQAENQLRNRISLLVRIPVWERVGHQPCDQTIAESKEDIDAHE